jgi:CelD/BcsL family acetyltransferase involved in cellulose biosynthesis
VLRLLHFSDINLAHWDACVAASPGVLPYAYAWWLQATAGRWAAVVELGPGGTYRSLLPLPLKWRPWGWVGFQPLFTQQLGLVLTRESQERKLADYLAIVEKKCAQFYQQLPTTALPLPILSSSFEVSERLTYHLDLGLSYPRLYQAYLAACKRRVRKNEALATPLRVEAGVELDELISLFLTYRGPEHTGLHKRHYARLHRLYAALQARCLAELRYVRHPATAELLAGALFVRHPGGLIYLFAATSPDGREASAPILILDDALRRHAGQPGQVFDFEGGSIPSIGRFFANFGARPVPYPTLTLTTNPWFLRWMRP